MRLGKLGIVAGLVVACIAPASAAADTAKIGSTLSHANTPSLSTNAIGVQRGASSGLSTFPFVSPADGIVTSWSVRTGDTGAVYGLRILRPVGGTSYSSAGASALAPAIPSATDTTYDHTTSLPIKKGDSIGVRVDSGHSLPQFTTTNSADVVAYAPTFSDGNAATFVDVPLHELLLQATIKFCNVPDLSGLTVADAQAKLTAADCGAATVTTKKLKRKKKNKKKKGKVLTQATTAGTTAAPGTAVAITVGKLKKKKHKK